MGFAALSDRSAFLMLSYGGGFGRKSRHRFRVTSETLATFQKICYLITSRQAVQLAAARCSTWLSAGLRRC